MSVKNFIPQIWSARLLNHLDKNFVYADVVNKDYEGEIKSFGDTVKINQIGDVTISDYTGTLTAAEELTSTQLLLTIDKKKSFNFKVDDIDAVQANVKLLDKGMERAGIAVQDVIDKDIASLVIQAGIKVGNGTTPIALDVANAYDTIVDLAIKLDENNVPRANRFIILPPFVLGLLAKDPRFTNNYKVLENGVVEGGNISGFELRMSNNVPVTTNKYSIMAGSEIAISYAGQITEIEGYRPEDSFSDAVKGLFVYGTKVVQPSALVHLTATQKA